MKKIKLLLTVLIFAVIAVLCMSCEDSSSGAAGGGKIFTYTGIKYEISEELNGTFTWEKAMAQTSWNGSTGWRLPSKEEHEAAYDDLYERDKPLHNASLTNYLWSSSSDDDENGAWRSTFFNPENNGFKTTMGTDNKSELHHVRVIRPL